MRDFGDSGLSAYAEKSGVGHPAVIHCLIEGEQQ